MDSTLTQYVINRGIGDWASIIGVFIGVVGFIITIINVRSSKSAAEQAAQAVREVRKDLLYLDTVADFSSALTVMDEIKRLHRVKSWAILPDRYAELKKVLIAIRSSNKQLSDVHKSRLQSAIQLFSGIESEVEKGLMVGTFNLNIAKLNELVSNQIDSLREVLIEIKNNTHG